MQQTAYIRNNVKAEASKKIMLFVAIISCLVLAVNL